MHDWRRPLDRLQWDDEFARRHNRNETVPHGCLVATLYTFWHCDLEYLDLWHFDIILIDGRRVAKFGDFSFSRFGFIVRTDRITHRQADRNTESQRGWLIAIPVLMRLLSASVISVVCDCVLEVHDDVAKSESSRTCLHLHAADLHARLFSVADSTGCLCRIQVLDFFYRCVKPPSIQDTTMLR